MPGFYLSLPILFLKFWYLDTPLRLIKYLFSFNHAALQVLSLPLLMRTFFKPLKNEYRKGLVVFSIGMGIFIKTILIALDLIIFSGILLIEVWLVIVFVAWPIGTIYLLFT